MKSIEEILKEIIEEEVGEEFDPTDYFSLGTIKLLIKKYIEQLIPINTENLAQ